MVESKTVLRYGVPGVAIVLIGVFASGILATDPVGDAFSPNLDGENLNRISGYLSSLNDAVDHVVSSLISIQIGLFVIIGFILQKKYDQLSVLNGQEIVYLSIFLMAAMVSLYFGYDARLQVIELIVATKVEAFNISKTVGKQAFCVCISGAAAIAAACFSISHNTVSGR